MSAPLVRLAIALAVAFGSALIAWPATTLNRRLRAGLLLCAAIPIALSPMIVAASAPLVRLFAALAAIALLAKLYDTHVGAGQGNRPPLGTYIAFLPNIFGLVLRRLDDEAAPDPRSDLRRLLPGVLGTIAGGVLLAALSRTDFGGVTFLIEHAVKASALFLTLIPLSAAGAAAWRLAGGRALDFMRSPLAARTPAEFWRRYNRPVHQFFRADLLPQLGGLHSPVRTTFATFALSALVHEYVFGITIGRVQGYQTTFFLLQGCAVALTLRLRPRGIAALATWLGTLAFNLVSSVLFFASVNEVVPFYWNPLPEWLCEW